MNSTLPEPLASADFSPEQKEYLSGLFAGVAAQGQRFSDVEPAPAAASKEDLIFEERVKRELHPLDAHPQILENAAANKAPDKEEIFLGAKKVNLPELRGEIDKLLKLPSPPRLALAADKKAPVGALIAVLDILKQAGVKGELAAFTEPSQP